MIDWPGPAVALLILVVILLLDLAYTLATSRKIRR